MQAFISGGNESKNETPNPAPGPPNSLFPFLEGEPQIATPQLQVLSPYPTNVNLQGVGTDSKESDLAAADLVALLRSAARPSSHLPAPARMLEDSSFAADARAGRSFPPPMVCPATRLLAYYPLDAASLLPVLYAFASHHSK
jgi:hypothetical protein